MSCIVLGVSKWLKLLPWESFAYGWDGKVQRNPNSTGDSYLAFAKTKIYACIFTDTEFYDNASANTFLELSSWAIFSATHLLVWQIPQAAINFHQWFEHTILNRMYSWKKHRHVFLTNTVTGHRSTLNSLLSHRICNKKLTQ